MATCFQNASSLQDERGCIFTIQLNENPYYISPGKQEVNSKQKSARKTPSTMRHEANTQPLVPLPCPLTFNPQTNNKSTIIPPLPKKTKNAALTLFGQQVYLPRPPSVHPKRHFISTSKTFTLIPSLALSKYPHLASVPTPSPLPPPSPALPPPTPEHLGLPRASRKLRRRNKGEALSATLAAARTCCAHEVRAHLGDGCGFRSRGGGQVGVCF